MRKRLVATILVACAISVYAGQTCSVQASECAGSWMPFSASSTQVVDKAKPADEDKASQQNNEEQDND